MKKKKYTLEDLGRTLAGVAANQLEMKNKMSGLQARIETLENDQGQQIPIHRNHMHLNVDFIEYMPPFMAAGKLEQFRAEFISLMEEYGVKRLDGVYEKK